MKNTYLTLTMMILAAAFSRLIPHPWNFTAIGAMALLGGAAYSSRTLSLVVPLAALFVSDLVLGFHPTMVFVYGAVAMISLLGWGLRQNRGVVKLTGFSLLSSLLFFLITNLGVWIMDKMYPPTAAGLMSCYVAGIPFFGNQVAGDLFYTALLFGAYALIKRVIPAPAAASSI